jgi:hypothetical protein
MLKPTVLSKLRSFFVVLGVLLAWTSGARAATLNVGAGQAYASIQSALDAANPGDTVLVAPGTYHEHLDFHNKAITLVSSGGADKTILDGSYTGPVVYLGTCAGAPAVLDGFTVQHGFPGIPANGYTGNYFLGGGVVLVGNATVRNNFVTANKSCGIQVTSGSTLVENNHVSNNLASGIQDALGCQYGDSGIEVGTYLPSSTVVSGNVVEAQSNNVILLADLQQNVVFRGNIVRAGSVSGAAILVYAEGGNIVVSDNVIADNQGTGITFVNLSSSLPYGPNALSVVNNTFYENGVGLPYSPYAGVEIDAYSVGAEIQNNLVVHTTPTRNPVIACPRMGAAGTTLYGYNDIYAPDSATPTLYCAVDSTQRNEDPLLVSAATGDFQLMSTSPEIDAGNNTADYATTVDFGGNPRVVSGSAGSVRPIVDIGAFEYQGINGHSVSPQSASPVSYPGADDRATPSWFTPWGSQPEQREALGTKSSLRQLRPLARPSASTAADSCNVTLPSVNMSLNSSANPSLIGQSLTFTASTDYGQVPPGFSNFGWVTFVVDGSPVVTGALTPTGSLLGNATSGGAFASYTSLPLTAGTHAIWAVLDPAPGYLSNSVGLSQLVQGYATSAVLSVTPVTAQVGATVALTATVAASGPHGNAGLPTGTVTFTDAGTEIGSARLNSADVAAFTSTTLPPGVDALSCRYLGDANYAASDCNVVPVTIRAGVSGVTLSANRNPAAALTSVIFTVHLGGQSVFAAVQTVQLAYRRNGGPSVVARLVTDASGNASYTWPPLAAGTYTVTANFTGTANLLASSASLVEAVRPNVTVMALNAAPNPAYQGQTVQVNAAVSTAMGVVPVGTVTLLDGSAVAGTATLAQGSANFSLRAIAAGIHSLSVNFWGDENNLASSSTLTLSVLPNDFTLSIKVTSLTVRTEHHITFTLNAASIGAFADHLQMSGVSVPPHVTLQFKPEPMTLEQGGSGSVTVYLDTDDVIGFRSAAAVPDLHGKTAGGALALAFLPWLGLAIFRRRRGSSIPMLMTLVCAAGLILMAGCGDKYPGATAPGTYNVQISATGTATGRTHTVTIPLVVTK